MFLFKLFIFIFLVMPMTNILAQSKDGYHLFNPTPEAKIRGLIPDRPSQSDGPNTVDAGHFQIETDLIVHTTDKVKIDQGTERTSSTSFNNINLKAGLTNNSDLQVLFATYTEEKVRLNGESNSTRGFGDITLRYKYNLTGNDDPAAPVFGLIPFVKLPTASAGMSNDSVEGGLSIPFSVLLPNEWSLGSTLKFDHLKRGDGPGHQTNYFFSWIIGREIVKNLSGFVEFASTTSDNKADGPKSTANLILTYNITPKIQFDTGTFIGLTEAAPDMSSFLGMSLLF